MEAKCVDDFETVSITCNKPNNQTPSASATSTTTLAVDSKITPEFLVESASSQPPAKSSFCRRDSTSHFNFEKAEEFERPTTSRGSMSLLQEDFETNSQHAFAEVVLDDENTTSGVLEAYEISSSDLIPPSTTNDEVSSETVANAEDSSSTDAIQIIKVSDSSTGSSVSNNGFFNSSEVYVINDDDDDDDDGGGGGDDDGNEEDDDEDEEDDDDVEEDDVDDVGEEAEADIDDDDEELEDVIAEVADSNDVTNLQRVDVDEEDDEEDDMNSTNQSATRNAQINGAEMSNAINNGVIVNTNGGMIFLETPVIEEQQHHLHHNPQMNTNAEVSEFMADKNVKPKRLSDEFSKDSNEPATDTPISSSMGDELGEKVMPKHRTSELIYNLSDAQICPDNERMSSRLKNMNLNNSNLRKGQDVPSSSSQAAKASDVKSMDLLERRDFEHEQRLTGGIILKSSSLTNNDTVNLGLLKSLEATKDSKSTQHVDGELASSSGGLNRGFFSDSKCTYKDLSATPTSSRKLIVRLTKSTAKMNLCNSLSHSPPNLKYQLQAVLKTLQHNTAEQTLSTNATSCDNKPSSTSTGATPCSSKATASSSSATASCGNSTSVIVEPPSTAGPEMFANSNSNDSLISRPSSTSVAVTSKQTNSQKHESRNAQDQSSSSKPETSISNSSTAKTLPTLSLVRVFENGCSRTSAIQPLLNNSSHNSNADANVEPDDLDDAQPSTSSARCQYAPPPRLQRQVNASAQTNEKYLASRSNVTGNSGQASAAGDLIGSSRNSARRTETSLLAQFKLLNEQYQNFAYGGPQESTWGDCEESNSDIEEICTCYNSSMSDGSCHGGSDSDLNDVDDLDASHTTLAKDGGGELSHNILQNLSISEEVSASPDCSVNRKRKYNDTRLIDHDYNSTALTGGGVTSAVVESSGSKRIAYDFTSTPRSSQTNSATALMHISTPTLLSISVGGSPLGRRTPRTLIPTRDNPPPELQHWLLQFQRWSHVERLVALDSLIEHCEPTQVRHMMKVIEPQFQRDFISLLPRELALQVLSYLDPKDLLRAAQTCRSWRFLCDDNLLWKEKCRTGQILTEPRTDRPKRGRAGNMPPIASPWKAAYMRQHIIEMNWRSRPIRQPKVLKGHDEHVITCLQFSGNRIVSGSDDNTLKVWSAVTGRCLRTLVGHTGGVWSSQMAGNIIISGSTDRTLKVWNMETGQCVHTLLGHTSTVRCMHLHGNKVVSGSRDATLRVWDIDQGTCLRVLVGHLAAVRCVQYDGKLIVSGAYDYMVKIWHPERSECLHTLQGHTNRVYSLQFDGIHVVSGSLDTSIRVWDVETGNCKHTLMGHQSLTSGMELRENILVSGNADSTVKVWDITTGQCLQTLSGPNKHQSAVTCLQFNSRFVVTSSDDGTVKLWDVKTGEFIRNLVSLESGGSGGVVWRIRANDTKLICAVGSRNGTEETKLMVLDFDVEGACVKCS